MQQLHVWRSFACNNSSSYRIIARFSDEAAAREAAHDLQAFYAEASPLAQNRPKTTMKDVKATAFPATDKIDALAQQHNFDWSRLLISSVYDGDELELYIEGTTLIAFHPYCLGLGEDLPKYFAAKGATKVDPGSHMLPTISVRFRWPEDSALALSLRDDLTAIFAQANTHESLRDWKIRPTWWQVNSPPSASSALTAFFSDDDQAGFYFPIHPSEIESLKAFLTEKKVRHPRLQICEPADLTTFKTIATARCNHCESHPPLFLIDKIDHNLPTDQLACKSCGGMFDLDQMIQEEAAR